MGPTSLFTPDGEAALQALAQARPGPLLAFDFDGTLAPIVDNPAAARADAAVAARLQRLAARWPVAVITGRAVADVQARLGFEPQYVVGNHGAEHSLDDPADADKSVQLRDGEASRRALEPLRLQLQPWHAALTAAGVLLEDKGASLALHFRRAPDRVQAQALIMELLQARAAGLRISHGKLVVNVMAAGAPDKAAALLRLLAASGAGTAFFAGDDLNDEPVFAAAPPQWVTVRVGPGRWPTQARFEIDGPERMAAVLDRLIGLMDTAPIDTTL